ncbi:MAG: AmpD protein [Cocleimonas sp.]
MKRKSKISTYLQAVEKNTKIIIMINKTIHSKNNKIINGLLENARQCPSPNCDDRPTDCEADLIVIHNISLPPNKYGGGGIDQLFTNQLDKDEYPYYADIHQLRVSSHLLIRRDGEMVQYVPFNKRAWHAGISEYQGRDTCNNFSIGIEMEGSDFEAFTEDQYIALEESINSLLKTYPNLSKSAITGHEHIAPGRKTDPGPFFEWQRLGKKLSVKLPSQANCLDKD